MFQHVEEPLALDFGHVDVIPEYLLVHIAQIGHVHHPRLPGGKSILISIVILFIHIINIIRVVLLLLFFLLIRSIGITINIKTSYEYSHAGVERINKNISGKGRVRVGHQLWASSPLFR
jgi:hypothetical protein